MNPVIIIGGGVAGLSCACRLTEYGIRPLVIEKGSYPAHKVCGEFISPECMPWLKRWDIEPVNIPEVSFQILNRPPFSFQFPTLAGAMSHLTLDVKLKELAERRGAVILTETEVTNLQLKKTGTQHVIELKDKSYETSALVIGVGRKTNSTPFYIGIKAHFENPGIKKLEMHVFPGGYVGLAPIENNRLNVACLMKNREDPESRLKTYLPSHLSQATPWIKAKVGAFGFKACEEALDTYYIGDAFATIPPASGLGMTLALFSGIKAADFLVRKDPVGFKRYQYQQLKYPLLFAKALHHLLLSPSLASCLLPKLLPRLYPFTRI